ncbi:hypothetical protein [Pseudoalteromonas sp. G4]|nr:hypothetical protein [Pseudoalteromonas sp. G4]
MMSSTQMHWCSEFCNAVSTKKHNSQIEVLFGLYTHGLLAED